MPNRSAQTCADPEASPPRTIPNVLGRAVLDHRYARPGPTVRHFAQPTLLMAQGQDPNIIDHQALWSDDVFGRMLPKYVRIDIDALRSLLEGAGTGVSRLQLQSLRKLFPQRRLKGIVFVIAIS